MNSPIATADPYSGREQTKAKHFILRAYLQGLAFKVLRFFDVTYVDGFSGPWESRLEDFRDSSFMIAIDVLRDAQNKIYEQTGRRPRVCCFFSENDAATYEKLQATVMPLNNLRAGFDIQTFHGNLKMQSRRSIELSVNRFP